jgi:hypothetical protein
MIERRNGTDRRSAFRGGRRASDRVVAAALVAMGAIGLSVLVVDAAPKPCKPPLLTLSAPNSGTVGQAVPFAASVQQATGNCQVASWYLSFGDGELLSGQSATTLTTSHVYTLASEWTAELGAQAVTGPPAPPKQVRILVSDTPPPPPPPSGRGPQASIVCPVGAVNVAAGASIQSAVNANTGATTFCLLAGVHPILGSITPKSGNTFVGEFGAILDGTGWVSSDTTHAAFRAHNQDINDVAIRNLVIRNMPRGIHAYSSGWSSGSGGTGTCNFSTAGADRWTVENNDIRSNVVGVALPNYASVKRNLIRDNVGSDPAGADVNKWGGGYGGYLTQGIVFEDNEVANNGPDQRFALTIGTIFRNNWVHHNLRDGIWYDGENRDWLIEGNLSEDNPGMGLFMEVSGNGTGRNNIIRRNGHTGIFHSLSRDAEYYGNTLEHNFRGMQYFIDCSRLGFGNEIGVPFDLTNNLARDNTFIVSTRAGEAASVLNTYNCTAEQTAIYTNGSKNNTYQHNAYDVPSLTGAYWFWGAFKTWAQWQALGQDTTGTVQ